MNDVYIIESWFGERRNLRQVYAADADDALQTHALHYRGEHVVSVRPRRTAPTASRRGFERTHRRAQRFGLSPFALARASGRRRRRDGRGRRRRRRRSGHGTSMLGRSAGIDCLRTILIDAPARLKHHVAAHLFPGLRHKSCSCPSSVPCTSSVPRKFRGAAGTTCCAYAPRMRHGMQQRCAAARLGRRAVSSHLCL
jgi:hypothetical protein